MKRRFCAWLMPTSRTLTAPPSSLLRTKRGQKLYHPPFLRSRPGRGGAGGTVDVRHALLSGWVVAGRMLKGLFGFLYRRRAFPWQFCPVPISPPAPGVVAGGGDGFPPARPREGICRGISWN